MSNPDSNDLALAEAARIVADAEASYVAERVAEIGGTDFSLPTWIASPGHILRIGERDPSGGVLVWQAGRAHVTQTGAVWIARHSHLIARSALLFMSDLPEQTPAPQLTRGAALAEALEAATVDAFDGDFGGVAARLAAIGELVDGLLEGGGEA